MTQEASKREAGVAPSANAGVAPSARADAASSSKAGATNMPDAATSARANASAARSAASAHSHGSSARGVGDHVDMLAQAREAQWSTEAFLGPDAIKIVAPAKVNLFLGVGSRMADGYHELDTVFHALALHDVIYMCSMAPEDEATGAKASGGKTSVALAGPANNIEVTIDMADKSGATVDAGTSAPAESAGHTAAELCGIPITNNLVFKAIDALAHEIGWTKRERIAVRVDKHIPAQAGLGGGSADAAAALLGAAHFWGLAANDEALRTVAARLGADVAFFLQGGCGLFSGRGEQLERTLTPMKLPVVLVKPRVGVSTAQAYAAFDHAPLTPSPALVAQVAGAATAQEVPLYNNLAPAAETLAPELAQVRTWLEGREGVLGEFGAPATQARTVSSETGVPAQAAQAAATQATQAAASQAAQATQAAATQAAQAAAAQAAAASSPKAVLLSGSGSAAFAVVETSSDALRIAAEAQANGWWARATTFSSLRATVV